MTLIVITGASQGIGAAIALKFAEKPRTTLALIARNGVKLEQVATQCREKGAETFVFPCDVTNRSAVAYASSHILSDLGIPHILINNAGLFQPGSFFETDASDFQKQLDVNLTSAFHVAKAFVPEMAAEKRGHVFFMASVASIKAYEGGVAYCAAKHGLLGLSRVIREETKDKGIRVSTLLPGATLTPSWEGTQEPEARFMSAEDIAQSVWDIYHLSDRTVVEEIVLRPQLGDL